MNAPVRRLGILITLLFVGLLAALTSIQYFQAKGIGALAGNQRTLLTNYGHERGQILVNGTAVALSRPTNDTFSWIREYPQAQLYSQVTGYYSYVVGAGGGLEGTSDDLLAGTADQLFVRRITDLITGRKLTGASVALTLNPKAQLAADQALGKRAGAVVALDPRTGAVLALVSHPQYNPNALSSHDITAVTAYWKAMLADTTKPMVNRAIAGNLYPPGSTFKVVTAAAALSNGIVADITSEVPGPANLDLPLTTTTLPTENGKPCGPGDKTTLVHALEISCNTAFGALGMQLGGDKLREQAAKFGFGDTLRIPLRVTPSSVPAELNEPQAAQAAIGQYDVKVTPLQMAMVAAGVANKGLVMSPYLVQEVRAPDLSVISQASPQELSQAVSPDIAAKLNAMMVSVVDNGSGHRAQIGGIKVAGKTGTAQWDKTKAPHAWFISFAPADDPRVAVAVIVEGGGVRGNEAGGAVLAAPIARAVMEAVINS